MGTESWGLGGERSEGLDVGLGPGFATVDWALEDPCFDTFFATCYLKGASYEKQQSMLFSPWLLQSPVEAYDAFITMGYSRSLRYVDEYPEPPSIPREKNCLSRISSLVPLLATT